MKRRFLIVLCAAALAATASGQDMRPNVFRSLFADQKANRIGDAITILVLETTLASNDARTNASRGSDLSLAASGSIGDSQIPTVDFSLGTGNAFQGEGGTLTRGALRAKLSATVDSVFANGNLRISGTRKTIINGEEQTVRISGIVRPTDIQPDNSVYSYNISEALIAFEGSGIVANAQGPGLITKLLHLLF
jgi:flagellar L-ring protein precursor FlgH